MATRPLSYPNWTITGANVAQPPSNLASTGWAPGVAPDAQHVNWLFGDINSWVQYLDQLTNTGIPISVIRLINGGTWAFNAQTGVLSWSAEADLAILGLPDNSNAIAAGSVTLADGQVAYVTANLPSYSQGDTSTSSNQNQITNMNFTGNIQAGYAVSGPGIPTGTTVLAVGTNLVTLSQNVTQNNTQATFAFAPVGALSIVVANSESVEPSIETILLARRSGSVVYLGVNCTQMVLHDGEFKTLQGYGYFTVYSAPAGQNLTAGQVVYLSAGATDSGRTSGAAYLLDCSAAYQAQRSNYAGIVISPVSTGQTATLLFSGFFEFASLAAGFTYYADPATPGGITQTPPGGIGERIVPIGFAASSTALVVNGANAATEEVPTYQVLYEEIAGYGNGVQTQFTASQQAISANAMFVFVDGLIIPASEWSLTGQTVTFASAPGIGQAVLFKYVLANQIYLSGSQETPVTQPNGVITQFPLVGSPINKASVFVYLNGLIVDSSQWSLQVISGVSNIVFNAAPAAAQRLYVTYLTPITGTSISGAQSIGSGVAVYDSQSGGTINFRSIKGGSGVSASYDGFGNVLLSATGSSAIEAHGSYASPITITAAGGITPTAANDQVWWVVSPGGAVALTANPQIAAGTTIGQRLTIKGGAGSDTNSIGIVNGSGVSQNGPITITTNASITYTWDGSQWSEDSRR